MLLNELQKGMFAQIGEILAPWDQKRRLLEMGFVPGSKVESMGRAPLRGPMIVRCRGTKIALRHQDAECIQLLEVI